MPSQAQVLSPSIMATLIRSIASEQLHPASVLANVHAKLPVGFGNVSAEFEKLAPGRYQVTFYKGTEPTEKKEANTPVEAKLLVLDHLVKEAKKPPQAT